MSLSDHEPNKTKVARVPRRAAKAKGCHWSDSQKLEAIQTYLLLGNVTLTAATLKIPLITLKVWRATAWWKELESELKLQDNLQLSAKLKNLVEKSLDIVGDRLTSGDFLYNNLTGQLTRKPVNLKDAHKVAIDLIDKKRLIDNSTVHETAQELAEEKLAKLAQKFAEMASKKLEEIKKPIIDVTDVVDISLNEPQHV